MLFLAKEKKETIFRLKINSICTAHLTQITNVTERQTIAL